MRKNKKNKKKKNCLLVILGPTASGKSDLAVKLARRFNGEVVSADSRQVYKGLDIGTGKITKKEMHGVPHHLLDVASPNHIFTAAEYQKLGKRALRNIWRRGKLPIICGGTGFYIDTLLYEYKLPGTKPNAALREKLEKLSADSLYEKLKKLDQARALTIDRHNKRRLIRALEIIAATGKPVPPPPPKTSPYFYLKIGIRKNEFELSGQIKKRLIKGLRTGLIGEVRGLLKSGVSMRRLDELGLEYRFVARYLRSELRTNNELIETLAAAIRRYAKRQMTWFKRDRQIHWISSAGEASRLAKKFLRGHGAPRQLDPIRSRGRLADIHCT